jgi:molybdopterin converting factor small subunit
MGGMMYDEHKLLDLKNQDELHRVIEKAAKRKPLVYVNLSHRQLGYSDEWLLRQLEESMVTGEAADRDFFNRWTSGSQQSPLSIAIAEIIRKSEAKTYYTEISKPHGYVIRWYLPENQIENIMRQSKFIMAIDTSDAVGNDDIGVKLRDIVTGAVVAVGNFNETNLIAFSEWVVNFLDRFQNVTAIIERRSTGAMVIDYLLVMLPMRNMDPFKRLYNKIVQEALEDKDRFRDICRPLYARDNEFYTKYKKAFGFATSAVGATSRSDLYGTTLLNSAKYTGTVVKDKKLIDQLLGLVIRNGRVDHAEGEHDDLVITWLLSYWLMTHGKNLEHYGISPSLVLSKCEAKVHEINSGDVYDKRYQEDLKNQIDELIETLKAEKDVYISRKYENRLINMVNEYKKHDNTIMSIDELLEQISKDKAVRFRHQQYLY